METKICTKCKKEFPLTKKYFRSSMSIRKNGKNYIYYYPTCKNCERERSREYKTKNKEILRVKRKVYDKKYAMKNGKKIKEYMKLYTENNKMKKTKYDKQYYIENKNRINERNKEYYQENKKQHLDSSRLYRKNNRKKVNEYYKNYIKNRRKEDINFKLSCNLKKQLWCALKRNQKSGGALELLGCSIEFFRKWLEDQFDKKMTWDNYGSYWVIDHILACNLFELKNSEEQETCFHYTNLRPLEKIENIRKSDKIL